MARVVRAGSSSGARVHKGDCDGRAMGGRRETGDCGRWTRVADRVDGLRGVRFYHVDGSNHPNGAGNE